MKKLTLLTPGPINTTDKVRSSANIDMWTRHKDYGKIIDSVRRDLCKIVNCNKTYTCILFTSSGTGAMESVITSIKDNQKALIVTNGSYGERFCEIADRYNINYYNLRYDWNKSIDINDIKKIIKKNNFTHIFITHHETTTGILNPIEEIGKIAKKNKLIYCVDAISSYAAIPINIKKLNVDYLIASSNKGIQGLPGLAFVICKVKKLNKESKSYYFDLYKQYEYLENYKQTRFTSSVQIMYALRTAIDEYMKEVSRYSRYINNYYLLKREMNDLGFRSYLSSSIPRSRLLETFCYYENGFDYDHFRDYLYNNGFVIYESSIPETFRVCNIGDIKISDIRNFIKVVKKYVKK